MKKLFYPIALLICCFGLKANGQTDNAVLTNVVSKLQTLSGDHIIENAYLHFDKPYYAAGDTMYYKAYVTLGEHHDLSKLSGLLYVDLIGPDSKIVRSSKLKLSGGLGWGDFALSRLLPKGNYRMRAYTKYMQNAGAEYFFDKKIVIGSVKDNSVPEENTAAAQTTKPDIQFFPEGGNFITGVESKVAFKAIGPNGLGINVKGVIVDNTNAEVAKFESSHLGMGTFFMAPLTNKTYKAKMTYADGSQTTVDLPKAETKGVMLAVIDSLNKFTVEVVTNKAYFQENQNKDLNILIYAGGMVNSVKTKLDSRVLAMDVEKDQFPGGIAQITLFSQTGEPLCERLLFLQNADMNLAVKGDNATYAKDGKVQINVNAKTRLANATPGHFSVSVTDENLVPADENNERTILTDLLLTSELKGYVEQPNYYFINPSPITRSNLDALMLTQGYRRFSWNKLLTNDYPKFTIPAENSFAIAGQVKNSTGEPLIKKSVLLRSTSASLGNSIVAQETDAQGRFKFENLEYSDTASFVIQAETIKGKKPVVTLDADKQGLLPVSDGSTLAATGGDVNAMMPAYLENASQQQAWYNNTIALKNVDVNTTKKGLYRSSNISGAGNADQVIKGEELAGFGKLSDALDGKIHGGYINSGVPYLSSSRTIVAGNTPNEPMLLIVDGVATDADAMSGGLDNFSPATVETIEVLKNQNAAIYGVRGAAGVLVITTRQHMLQPIPQVSGIGTIRFNRTGFYKAREFYSPKYQNFGPANPDLRSTIFWMPELVTDKDGNASFNFYNGDNTGTYKVVIEGIDEKGNVGRQVYRYKVE